MEHKQDPDIWIKKIEAVRTLLKDTHKHILEEEEFLSQLLCNLTPEYECLRHSMEVQLGQTTDTLDIDKLRYQLKSHYERSVKGSKVKNDTILLAESNKKIQ